MNEPTGNRRLKALVYGKSGTGKTNFGVSAPKPLILLNERQAIPHIRAAARRLAIAMPSVLLCQTPDDYRNVLRACHGDRSLPFSVRDGEKVVFELAEWPESLVLDSLTEACELIAAEIRRESPPKLGKDGLPVDSERYWNVFSDRAAKMIRSFRDVDLNILFLCLLDDRTIGEGDDAHRWVGPSLSMRKLPGIVQAAVNVVGVTYRKQLADKTLEYGISTFGPDYVELKPFPPLRPSEVTDFSSWCKRINGEDDGSVAPSPMTDVAEASVETKPAEPPKTTAGRRFRGPSAKKTDETPKVEPTVPVNPEHTSAPAAGETAQA